MSKQEDSINWGIQDSIICNRYFTALSFAEHYLEDIYKNFNFVAKEIKELSNKYTYLKFPKNIRLYTRDYVTDKIKKFNLKRGKLDGQ